MADGDHANETAWGFLGVRLPLPDDKQAAADRVTILKALGVLDPETGKPTPILDAVKAVRMAKLDQESWQKERDKMLKVCSQCHSAAYAKEQLPALNVFYWESTEREPSFISSIPSSGFSRLNPRSFE